MSLNVIGFGGSGHDWSTCILKNSKIAAAIDEERVSRKKYGIGSNLLTSESRALCLKAANLEAADINYAVACDLTPPTLVAPFRKKITRINHHLAHAYSTFFSSPFDSAAILIADNAGSFINSNRKLNNCSKFVETISYFEGRKNKIKLLSNVQGMHNLNPSTGKDFYKIGMTDNSLGQMYWIVSEKIGYAFKTPYGTSISEDGKTMALAGYGDNRFENDFLSFINFLDEGQIQINIHCNSFQNYIDTLLQSARNPEDLFEIKKALAFAVQATLEKGLLHITKYLQKKTKQSYLAVAGGVALNCVANAKIAYNAGFKDVFILPAAGDNGIALGSALFGLLELGGYQKTLNINAQLPFLGIEYNKHQFLEPRHLLAKQGIKEHVAKDLFETVSNEIAKGKIVAWYEGRSEFGPRALGHRSILADPRNFGLREKINKIIKERELFRPFATMILEEDVHKYFEVPQMSLLPYMLIVGKVKEKHANRLKAVLHVDNTSRIQTVSKKIYPSMFSLLTSFKKIAGVPVLLNTSFNRCNEPLVETPLEAVKCFLESDIDILVLEKRVYRKIDID